MKTTEIRINPKFRDLIPPLAPDEYDQLEKNLLTDGIRDPLVVWGDVLVDGHNRFEIARKHGLNYQTKAIDFTDENEAVRWIILNQFGRRNLTGIDYVATLHGGAEVYIDAKTREQGCSRFWKNGIPELAVEIWSNRERKTQGWAWSGKSNVDYILYTFARSDCDRYWFIPFQLMRKALYENAPVWFRKYPYKTQRSNTWTSGALFIPAPELVAAVTACMEGAAPYA